jgi:hypothetical protein
MFGKIGKARSFPWDVPMIFFAGLMLGIVLGGLCVKLDARVHPQVPKMACERTEAPYP